MSLKMTTDQERMVLNAARNGVPTSQLAKWCVTQDYQPSEEEVEAWLKDKKFCRECNQ